jgi:hypothetical protein
MASDIVSGSFTVNLKNATGAAITNVSVIHYCDGDTPGNVFSSVADGEAVTVCTAQTYTGHKDYWAIQFAYDKNFYQANCYCSPASGDTICVITVTADYYSIDYSPSGDGCDNKSYSYTTK